MKRLLIRLSIVITLIGLLLIPLNQFVKESWEYTNNRSILAFKENPHPVDIINLGTSHAMFAYYFKPHGLSHLDLALPSQTIEYDLKMLKAYDQYLQPGGVVLVSLSQITFSNSVVGRKGNYYQVLDRTAVEPESLLDYYTHLYAPALNSGSVYTALSRKIRDFRWDSHRPWENNGLNYSEKKYEMVSAQYRDALERKDIERNMDRLKEIVEYCQEKGYKVVLTMEPVHESYHEYFDEEVMNELVFQYLDQLDLNVPFLNYMGDPRFVSNQDFFHNPDHLNGNGRKLLSSLIYEDLTRIGYVTNNVSAGTGDGSLVE